MTSIYEIPMNGDISLRFLGAGDGDYPSCRLQRGLLLFAGDKDLSEEGVGFGVPVIKLGHETVFPGSARITAIREGDKTAIDVDYDLNIVERMCINGRSINNRAFYRIKESFSLIHREYPVFRKLLTHSSNTLRRLFGIEPRFEEINSFGIARVLYTLHAGNININVNTNGVEKDRRIEIMLMNEQGASYFDTYRDSNGLFLKGNAIRAWDEVFADDVEFIYPVNNIVFAMHKVDGARMFRGRELVEKRLAWSGIAYLLSHDAKNFSYEIRIG